MKAKFTSRVSFHDLIESTAFTLYPFNNSPSLRLLAVISSTRGRRKEEGILCFLEIEKQQLASHINELITISYENNYNFVVLQMQMYRLYKLMR